MTSGSAGASAPGPPSLPWVPAGANPETWGLQEVSQALRSAAYFPLFSGPDPDTPNRPLLMCSNLPATMYAVEVNERLHRLEIGVAQLRDGRLTAANRVGPPVARVHIRWAPIPEDYVAAPGREPPRTLLNPFSSQRFCMLDGRLTFLDGEHGFRAFGTGRTFPVTEGGQGRLRIGAVIDVLEGFGALRGLPATITVNGHITPPNALSLNLMLRVMDPDGRLRTIGSPWPLAPIPDPDPDAVFMMFLGEVDPTRPVSLIPAPDGNGFIGSNVFERLRLVRLDFHSSSRGLRSSTAEGPIVGTVEAQLFFNMFDPSRVIPITTSAGVFTFCDPRGATVGTVRANMVEGRALRTALPRFPMPLFRFGGFGPILEGTGCFADCDGFMSMNSAVSVFPRTLSNLYVFRFYDPAHRLHALWPGR